MKVVVNVKGVRSKYGGKAKAVLDAAAALSPTMDVSGLSRVQIHTQIAALPATDSILIVGGYDLVPPFVLTNPTLHVEQQQEGAAADRSIPSDGPYGGTPGNTAQQLLPTRPIARVPDGPAAAVEDLLATLKTVAAKPKIPAGAFQEAAQEFEKPALDVAQAMQVTVPLLESPPETDTDPALPGKLKGKGKIHILLHGANYAPDWGTLWGHAQNSQDWQEGLTSPMLRKAALNGSVVAFSTCYAAMVDLGPKKQPIRDASNQASLACLRAGAKAVFAVTRSNWIDTTSGDLFGPGLAILIWKGMLAGKKAGQALVDAKRQLATAAMSGAQADLPYMYKTLAQAQLYGNPEATLQ